MSDCVASNSVACSCDNDDDSEIINALVLFIIYTNQSLGAFGAPCFAHTGELRDATALCSLNHPLALSSRPKAYGMRLNFCCCCTHSCVPRFHPGDKLRHLLYHHQQHNGLSWLCHYQQRNAPTATNQQNCYHCLMFPSDDSSLQIDQTTFRRDADLCGAHNTRWSTVTSTQAVVNWGPPLRLSAGLAAFPDSTADPFYSADPDDPWLLFIQAHEPS